MNPRLLLVAEHIEKHGCPSLTSVSILGGTPHRFKADDGKRPQASIAAGKAMPNREIRGE